MRQNFDGLPRGWARARLADLVRPERPRVKPSDFADLPFIGMEHVEAHTMRLLGTVRAGEMKSSAVHFQRGDVLYGRLRPYLNKLYRPDFEGLSSAEFIVFPPGALGDTKFIQYLLNSAPFVAFASRINEGDRPRVDFAQIAGYECPVPPLAEQRRIVEEIEKQFSRLDAGVVALKRVQANLKRYQAAVLKAACEGRLVPTEAELARAEGRDYEPAEQLLKRILTERRRTWEEAELARMQAKGDSPKGDGWKARYKEPSPPDTSDLPGLPEGWCWATLDAIAVVTKLAGFEYTKYVRYDPSGDLPVIKAENVSKRGFVPTEFSYVKSETVAHLTRSKLEPDDVLMVFVGTPGQVARVPAGRQFFLGPNVALIRVKSQWAVPGYVELFLRSPLGNSFVVSMSKATTQASISMAQIRLVPIAVPSVPEQPRILSEVERLLSLSGQIEATVEANLRRAERLRQAILRQAFEGKLVPQDPTDEPASVLLERIKAERTATAKNIRRTRRNGIA